MDTVCVKILDRNSSGYMSTFKLSGRRGIKNWRVSTNISLHFEKHPRYELGNASIDVGLMWCYRVRNCIQSDATEASIKDARYGHS